MKISIIFGHTAGFLRCDSVGLLMNGETTPSLKYIAMISITDFQSQFLDYAARSRIWNELQFSEEADDLNDFMVLIVEGEEQMLQAFGLPCTLSNSRLMQKYALMTGLDLPDVSALYFALAVLAEEYLSKPVVSDLNLLLEAQRENSYIHDVLPLTSLGVKAEPYYLFLYDELFLKEKISAQLFLDEVKMVKEHHLSQRLQHLSDEANWKSSSEYLEISGFGLKCLDDFLQEFRQFETDFKMVGL